MTDSVCNLIPGNENRIKQQGNRRGLPRGEGGQMESTSTSLSLSVGTPGAIPEPGARRGIIRFRQTEGRGRPDSGAKSPGNS